MMLNITALVDSLIVDTWKARLLSEARRFGEVEVRIQSGRGRSGGGTATFLWKLMLALDRRAHPVALDALVPRKLEAFSGSFHKGASASAPDVVLDLRQSGGPRTGGLIARHGVWSVHIGDGPRIGPAAAFASLATGDPVIDTKLAIENGQEGRCPPIIWVSAVDQQSPYRTLNRSAWNGYHLILRQLRLLQPETRVTLDAARPAAPAGMAFPEHRSGEATRARPVGHAPGMLALLRFAVRFAARGVRRRIERRRYRSDWYIAVRRKRWHVLAERDERGFAPLPLPTGHFHADPFLFAHEGAMFLFFEDYSYRERRGVIGCRTVSSEGLVGAPQTVLERPCHLSYPFVFSLDGNTYLIPETTGNRTVELYRSDDFPRGWKLERVLMRDIHAADVTLFQHDGSLWLFANVAESGTSDWDALHVFFADSLFGEWRPHPLNPVVRDVRTARPAGRLFWDAGRLIRPAQDCSVRYGHAISLNRVDVLTRTEYAEALIGRIGPNWRRGNLATHGMDHTPAIEVIDGRLLVRRQPRTKVRPRPGSCSTV